MLLAKALAVRGRLNTNPSNCRRVIILELPVFWREFASPFVRGALEDSRPFALQNLLTPIVVDGWPVAESLVCHRTQAVPQETSSAARA